VVAQVNQTMPLISAIGTVANPGFDWSVFMGHVSALIDAVVGISNQLGAFQTTSKGATTVASK
jgi:hypothetical protein